MEQRSTPIGARKLRGCRHLVGFAINMIYAWFNVSTGAFLRSQYARAGGPGHLCSAQHTRHRRMCVFFTLNRYSYPPTSSTPTNYPCPFFNQPRHIRDTTLQGSEQSIDNAMPCTTGTTYTCQQSRCIEREKNTKETNQCRNRLFSLRSPHRGRLLATFTVSTAKKKKTLVTLKSSSLSQNREIHGAVTQVVKVSNNNKYNIPPSLLNPTCSVPAL